MSNTDTQKTPDASSAASGRVGSSESSASDTPRTDAAVNAGGYQLGNVVECSRQLERQAERVRKAALDQWAELRKTIHSLEADVVALTARAKHLEDQRNTLNETCQTLRAQITELSPNNGDDLRAQRK